MLRCFYLTVCNSYAASYLWCLNLKKLIVVTLAELSLAPQRKESNSSITRVCQDGFMILTDEPLLRHCLHCILMKTYSTD